MSTLRQGRRVPVMLKTRDPAVASAVGKCASYRLLDLDRGWYGPSAYIAEQVRGAHPERCLWCDTPIGDLLDACDEFNDWAWPEPERWARGVVVPVPPEVRAFERLPHADQRALVRKAQYGTGEMGL